MKMIDNARAVWRHYSTQSLAFVTTLGGAWASVPDWAKTALPSWVPTAVAWIVFIVAALGLGGKFIDQSKNDSAQTEAQKDPQ